MPRPRGILATVDLALLDVGLPDGLGTELVAVLREANTSVKVVILSASIEAGMEQRMREAGVDGVLNKMAPLAEITAEVGRLVGGGSPGGRH